MQVFCVVAEIEEIHSLFLLPRELIICLGVELASLSYFNYNEIPGHTKLSNFSVKKKCLCCIQLFYDPLPLK